jgi:hypothetical protein
MFYWLVGDTMAIRRELALSSMNALLCSLLLSRACVAQIGGALQCCVQGYGIH